ncbi:MAG: hypothetical protein JKY65_06900 [Planctomycetes bacterium]|nr:hypothetical protein [Planctomycetota bacterium]
MALGSPRLASLAVVALALVLAHFTSGCKSPAFSFEEDDSSAEAPAVELGRPLRPGFRHVYRKDPRRFKAIVGALRNRDHTVSLVGLHDPMSQGPLDYVFEARVSRIGRPSAFPTFLVGWVFGPIFGAPGWAGFQYDYEVRTELSVTRAGSDTPCFTTTVVDIYDLNYTSFEYSMLIYAWDFGFISGIVACSDELTEVRELEPVEAAFFLDEEISSHYLRRVVRAIEKAAADDLKRGAE